MSENVRNFGNEKIDFPHYFSIVKSRYDLVALTLRADQEVLSRVPHGS